MRTTVDLPDPLVRAAKAKAAAAGESLKTLFERALTREVGGRPGPARQGRVEYPLIRSRRSGADLTAEQLDEILTADEIERYAP